MEYADVAPNGSREYGFARFAYKYVKGGVKVDEIERVYRILLRQQLFNSNLEEHDAFIPRNIN
jgi:hypothetical protein